MWSRSFKSGAEELPAYMGFAPKYRRLPKLLYSISMIWFVIVAVFVAIGFYIFYLKNSTQLSAENVVLAYYDALDFKEFERAHSYLDPAADKSISQFMLEISVTDGLLSSYAKLDNIAIDITTKTDSTATGFIKANWVTPLKVIDTRDTLYLKKINNKWYIKPKTIDPDVPPEQLVIQSTTQFYNHGKRKITSEQTYHEDVLKQPVVEVLSARMIVVDGEYAIIGEIQNVDNVPADISVTGTLYDFDNNPLAKFNAKDVIKHKLLPKETTPYRVNFEDIAWATNQATKPASYDPAAFTKLYLSDTPVNFQVQVVANVATTDLYQAVASSQVEQNENLINGFLFNPSIEAATIPQLLISYYDKDQQLIWVESIYIDESVRQQRKRKFQIDISKIALPEVLSTSLQNVSVNGLPNQSISDKVVPNRNNIGLSDRLIPVKNMPFGYISITPNSYIGNPE
jgi:hypothetical protein